MLSKHATINITTDWTELSEDFDILIYGLFSESSIEFQEYRGSSWSSTLANTPGDPYSGQTSARKLRVRAVSGTASLNYSLWGFIAYNVSDMTTEELQAAVDHVDVVSGNPHEVTAHEVGTFTQEEIMELFGGATFNYFLSKDAEGVIPDYNLLDAGDELTSEGLITVNDVAADDTLIKSFVTPETEPTFINLDAGIYSCHIHAYVSAVLGNNTIGLYFKLYKRSTLGVETLVVTSDVTKALTTSEEEYELHANLESDVVLASDDRLVVKLYANVLTPSGGTPDVTILVEGDTSSRIEVRSELSALDSRYLRVRIGATEDNVVVFDENGNSKDSGISIGDLGSGNFSYQGTLDCAANPDYPAADQGDLYLISGSGKVGGNSGKDVALNNFIICLVDSSSSGDEATVGANWRVIGGDMRKSVYDSDGDGIVDEAESINDGSNYATAADIVDGLAKAHDQNTDTSLDEGGENEVTAAQAKAAYTHSTGSGNDHSSVALNNAHRSLTSGNPHQVTKAEVGLNNVPNIDTTNAVNKAHDQNTDTGTNQNNFNVGDGADTDKTLTASNGDVAPPKIRYTASVNKWQYTNNGVDWYDFGSAVGAGDMLMSIYDTDEDGIVDKAASVDDGAGNSVSAADIKSAVDNDHTHANKATLDSYNQSNVDLSDAVSKKHSQNTDTGTNQNSFTIGDGVDGTKEIVANNADENKPKLLYNHVTNTWQLSNNGVDFSDIQAGSGSGDMLKATYDSDDDGVVDESEIAQGIDDGAGNSATASQIAGAVTNSHSHANKATLDNIQEALTSALKIAYDSAVTDSHTHANKAVLDSYDQSNEDLSEAVTNSHEQNTDIGTNSDDFSIGDGIDTTKTITANNGDASKPQIRYNSSANAWQYTNNGADWYNFGVSAGGEGSGDMSKATYDADEDGIVDAAEILNDGTDTLTISEILKMHSNSMLNSIRIAIANTLGWFRVIDGFVDAYVDETGIDGTETENESYDESGDFYANEAVELGIDAYTVLMLHFDSDDESTTIVDETGNHSPICYGNTKLTIADDVFGTACLVGDGSSGSRVIVPGVSDYVNFGTGDFTIDFWIKRIALNAYVHILSNTSFPMVLAFNANNTMRVVFGGVEINTATVLDSTSSWYHIELARFEGTGMVFFNGIKDANTLVNAVGAINLGTFGILGLADWSDAYAGKVDEFRISKGIARHTANFSVPTGPYSSGLDVSDMTVQSIAVVAQSTPSRARFLLIEEDVSESVTLNTDLKAYVSRDGGTTFTQGTLGTLGAFDDEKQILVADVDLSAQPSGTDLVYKYTTHNSKQVNLHASALNWY
jgi:hypothetical protein